MELVSPVVQATKQETPRELDEIDIARGVEVGFIIATTCTSLELDEDEDVAEEPGTEPEF